MWLDTYPGSLEPRAALEGDTDTDVAIVGGGFTGLWTAYYLRRLDPTLRVAVIEREVCGFGASGRNGGWAVGELAAGIEKYAALADLPASLRLARAVFDSVDELYGSRISPSVERHHRSHERIHATLVNLFPALSEARITHRWGGVLAVPRNWTPFVHFDRDAGTAGAGGYVGEGVAPSNLAGRTLADLITGTDSERVDLPWVGVRHRRWEPEPLRWLGVRGSRWILAGADTYEYRTNREAKAAVALAHKIRND